MMLDYPNATCRLLKPRSAAKSGDALQREHRFVTLSEQRCSFRALTGQRMVTVLGRISANAWTLRLQTSETPTTGWRVQVRRDGQDEWEEFSVALVTRSYHWVLRCEGATG